MENPEDLIAGLLMLGWFAGLHIGMAGVFRKVGLPVWHTFVPFFNGFQLCKVARISPLWLLAIFVPLLNFAFVLYLGIKLSHRFGYADWFGVVLGLSGLGLLPIIGFSKREALQFEEENEVSALVGLPENPEDQAKRSTRVALIVATTIQLFSLLCIPGFLVVGIMAFDGVSSLTPAMNFTIGVACLIPITILCALIGQWALYAAGQFKLAVGMSALPVLNGVALIASAIVSFA